MVSNGPSWQPANMTHMYDFNDRRGVVPITAKNNSLFGILTQNPRFSKMAEIVLKAKMEIILQEKQSDFTFFITPNEAIEDINVDFIDVGLAKQIVLMSLLDNKIYMKVLRQSPCRYLNTKNNRQRLYVTCLYDEVIINENSKVVIADIPADNGIIHIVSNLLIPNTNTFMN